MGTLLVFFSPFLEERNYCERVFGDTVDDVTELFSSITVSNVFMISSRLSILFIKKNVRNFLQNEKYKLRVFHAVKQL